uniref:Neprosin PEP catalytic domain-containing protein n=1 Tax=Vitis vinifera TaxID=29760 RepID=F6I6H6_VITVI
MLGLPDPCLGWATLLRPNFPHERPKLTAHFYGRNDEPIGYWPEGLLRNFTSHATTAVWGGTAVGEDPFPPMGSGHKFTESLEGGYGSACYIRGMKVVEKLGGNFTDVNDDWNSDEDTDWKDEDAYYWSSDEDTYWSSDTEDTDWSSDSSSDTEETYWSSDEDIHLDVGHFILNAV